MKKIAVLQVEFDPDIMISEEDLKEYWNNNWVEFMQELFKDESIGIFDEEIKLVDIIDKEIISNMSEFIKLKEEDKKEWIEIKLKVPKNTIALITNYIYQDKKGVSLGNSQYDTDDIEKMKVRRNK